MHSPLLQKRIGQEIVCFTGLEGRTPKFLGIVSKNNEEDVESILRNHSHMVLRNEDFVIKKINWTNKVDNVKAICNELNLGLDSIVFFDDNPLERQLIMQMLPEVVVPDFPERPEGYS